MRTATAGEIAVVAAAALSTYARLEITSPDGVWKNVSSDLAGGHDWLNSVQVSEQIDSNTMGFSAELLRDASATLSLAPLREDSTVNRNLANVYAPMLDLHRKWRFSVAVIAHGTAVVSGDWKQIGTGYVDIIDVNHPTPSISVSGRGEEAALLDTEILTVKTYSTGSTAYMENVIQSMINDHWDSSYGATPVLYTPVATDFVINQFDQPAGNLMNALTAIANLIGASLRYRYDAAGVNRLTLYVPNRTATIADWDIESTEYLRIPRNRLDITGVRNYVRVNYVPTLGGIPLYTVSPNTGTSGSITTFGKRAMLIDLSADTQIDTAERAQALGDAIVADLEYPKLEQMFETFGFWYVQLQDYGKTIGNGIHYEVGNDQEGGVSGYSHTWANGALRTSVELGGQPKSGYKRWRPLGEKPLPTVPPIIYDPVVPPFVPGTGPLDLPGCELWLKADSLLFTTVNGGAVSFWADQSGTANHATQATTAAQPVFKTNVKNGLPAVETSAAGTADWMKTSVEFSAITAGTRLICIVAQKVTSGAGTFPRFIEKQAATAGARITVDQGSGTGVYYSVDNADAFAVRPFSTTGETLMRVYSVYGDNSVTPPTAKMYLNGVQVYQTFEPHASLFNQGYLYIATQDGTEQFSSSRFGEIFVFNNRSPAEVASLHDYAVDRWAAV